MRHMIPKDVEPVELRVYLARALSGMPEWVVRKVLAERQVKREGRRLEAAEQVRGGEELVIYLPREAMNRAGAESAAHREPEIPTVYEDAHIWLVNKPQGIASQRADDPRRTPGVLECLQAALDARGERCELRLCHRLDHQTGGLLLLTKGAEAEALLREAFARRALEKTYTCLVAGTPEPTEATLTAYLRKNAEAARVTVRDGPFAGAQPIETAYRVLCAGDIARLEVRLITGRTHQIRAHLAHIGHPVLGDDKYGDRALNRRQGARVQKLWATRLVLHVGGALADLNGRAFVAEAPF